MANITWDASTPSGRKKRARCGNRWLVAGDTVSAASGDAIRTGLRELDALSFVAVNATAASYAIFVPQAGQFTAVHTVGSASPLTVFGIGK